MTCRPLRKTPWRSTGTALTAGSFAGRTLHRCLDARLNNQPFVHETRWDAWLDPLFADPLFKGIETVATEYLLVDRYRSVCGSCDFVIRHKDDPSFVILGDLKTVSSKKAVSAGSHRWLSWGPTRACGSSGIPRIKSLSASP